MDYPDCSCQQPGCLECHYRMAELQTQAYRNQITPADEAFLKSIKVTW